MNLTKTFGLTFLASALLLSACKKDDDDTDTPPATTCKLAKSVFYDQNGVGEDSATFTYNGDKITKATAPEYYYTFEYTGERVTKRNAFQAGSTTAEYYQIITYNSDGMPNKIETFDPSITTNGGLWDRMEFTYSSGKLQKIDYLDFTTGSGVKIADFVYAYTGNNITTATFRDLTVSPIESLTINYGYDSNPNYFKKQNSQIFYLDPVIFGDGDVSLLPFAFSENNAVSLGIGGQTPAPFSYTLDSRQNLKDIKVGNRLFSSYTYQCQ